MRFKIYSTIFIFVACFLLFSYNPIQGGMQEKDIFSGDPLSDEQKESFFTKISNLDTFYQEQNFDEIGKFYKDTGLIKAYDLKPIQGRGRIVAYFRHLFVVKKVRVLEFKAKSCYAKRLIDTTVRKLLRVGAIQGQDIPDNVNLNDNVTHALHAIISVEFTDQKGKKHNQGFGSGWDGWHIDGCPIF